MKVEGLKYKIILDNKCIDISTFFSSLENQKDKKEIDDYLLEIVKNNINWMENDTAFFYKKMKDNKSLYIYLKRSFNTIEAEASIIDSLNPFLLDSQLKENTLTQGEINYYFSEEFIEIFKVLFQCILYNDKPIYITIDNKKINFLLRLIGTLLPNKYVNTYSFSMSNVNENINIVNNFDFNEDTIGYFFNFDINDYPYDIIPKRYVFTVVNELSNSLSSSLKYKKEIDRIMNEYNLDLSLTTDVINLLDGRLEGFPKTEGLSKALDAVSNMKHDSKYISSLIYSNLHKYEVNEYILNIYKYVYDNVESSHDLIIKSYMDNFSPIDCDYIDYLKLIEKKAPFVIIDYLYYLKKNNLYDDKKNNGLKDFNYGYFLFELICRDIKCNNKSIVPNDDLLFYISCAVDNKNIIYLDRILNRINKLNSKASSKLLLIKMNELDKKYRNLSLEIGLEYSFLLLERIVPIDSLRLYTKIYNSILDRRLFIKELVEREKMNPDYYHELLKLFKTNDDSLEIFEKYNLLKLYSNQEATLDEILQIYKDFYLNKYKSDNGMLIAKVISYLESKDNSVSEAISLYRRLYKPLDINYKDVIDSTRKINEFIYKNPVELIKNDSLYFDDLTYIQDILDKYKSIPNPYYLFIKFGLDIKNGYLNKNYLLINRLVEKKQFINYNEDMKIYFVKYYLKYLVLSYFETIPIGKDIDFIKHYHNLFDEINDNLGFSNVMIDAIATLGNNKAHIFYYLVVASNSNNRKYHKILINILDSLDNKVLKLYLKDYIKSVNEICWLNGKLKENTIKVLEGYIKEKFSLFERLSFKIRR